MVRILFALLGLLCLPAIALEQLDAQVDHSRLYAKQSLLLTIKADDQLGAGALDIQPLLRHFMVGEVRFNTQSANGHYVSQWQIPLLPLQSGSQQIPALKVADLLTPALLIEVSDKPAPASTSKTPLSMEVHLDKAQLYSHETGLYQVRLFQRPGSQLISASSPLLQDQRLHQIGDDQPDTQIMDGKRVKLLIRTYALRVDTPGDYQIQGPLLQGQRLSSDGTAVQDFLQQADSLHLTISPLPEAAQGRLPSQELSLQTSWLPSQGPFRVGEPILRTVTLKARGNTLDQLPEIPLPQIDGFRSYEDGIQNKESADEHGLIAERSIRQAFIPLQAGTLTLPELQIDWFNTRTGQIQSTHSGLPSLTIQAANSPSVSASHTAVSPAPRSILGWPWLTLLFALAWLLTLLVWWRYGRRYRKLAQFGFIDDQLSWRRLKQTLHTQDPKQVHQALLHWGQQRWPALAPTGLERLPCYQDMRTEMDELLAACFAEPPHPWNAQALRRALLNWQEQQAAENTDNTRLNPDEPH